MDSHNINFVDVDGIRTRYYESGQGEFLILFHEEQFGGLYSLDCWSLHLGGLLETFHLLAVDKLGQGYTDNPKSAEHYTSEPLVRHTMKELMIKQVGAM
jgi:2-hydroxy-6-oxonona-2,4-dienedioate hydrolase